MKLDADRFLYGKLTTDCLVPPLLSLGGIASLRQAEKLLRLYKGGVKRPLQEQLLLESEYKEGAWPDLWDQLLGFHLSKQIDLPKDTSFRGIGGMWGGPDLLLQEDFDLQENDLRSLALLALESEPLSFLRRRMVLSTTPVDLDIAQMQILFLSPEDSPLDLMAREMLAHYFSATILSHLKNHFDLPSPKLSYAMGSYKGEVRLHLLPDAYSDFAACRRRVSGEDDVPYAAWADARFTGHLKRCPDCLGWAGKKENGKRAACIESETSLAPRHLLSQEACLAIAEECSYHSPLRFQLRKRIAEDSGEEEICRLIFQQALGVSVRVISEEMNRRPGQHLLAQLLPDPDVSEKIRALPDSRKEDLLLQLLLGTRRDAVARLLAEEIGE